MPSLETENIIGYPVVRENKTAVLNAIAQWLQAGDLCRTFICANPHSLIVAEGDSEFKAVFSLADLVTPDGIGVVYASKILGGSITERITGSDIFHEVNQFLNTNKRQNFSCFFLGSTNETLEQIKQKFSRDYPSVGFAGSYSPPYKVEFTEDDNRAMIEAINVAKPDVLWVGMTAPKQEKWIMHNRDQLDVKFIGAIGAVFDFYVGNVKRSHPVFLKLGLEWLPRLLQEPKRLWRRNLVSTPIFLAKIFAQRFGLRDR
jgi:N-acetylglucosaminyldiphosphoundecaprenol N-acetyl-beta-D-mannosaminyltransferase